MSPEEKRYNELQERLAEIEEERGGIYLADPNVDGENADHEAFDTPAYWRAMYDSAAAAAGHRAQEEGFDINDHFDRPIF